MTNEIISIESIELDRTNSDGSTDWIITANIADMRLLRPAVYHPAEVAEPEEWGPGICSAVLSIDDDEPSNHGYALKAHAVYGITPSMILSAGTETEQIFYLQDMDLDWQLDED